MSQPVLGPDSQNNPSEPEEHLFMQKLSSAASSSQPGGGPGQFDLDSDNTSAAEIRHGSKDYIATASLHLREAATTEGMSPNTHGNKDGFLVPNARATAHHESHRVDHGGDSKHHGRVTATSKTQVVHHEHHDHEHHDHEHHDHEHHAPQVVHHHEHHDHEHDSSRASSKAVEHQHARAEPASSDSQQKEVSPPLGSEAKEFLKRSSESAAVSQTSQTQSQSQSPVGVKKSMNSKINRQSTRALATLLDSVVASNPNPEGNLDTAQIGRFLLGKGPHFPDNKSLVDEEAGPIITKSNSNAELPDLPISVSDAAMRSQDFLTQRARAIYTNEKYGEQVSRAAANVEAAIQARAQSVPAPGPALGIAGYPLSSIGGPGYSSVYRGARAREIQANGCLSMPHSAVPVANAPSGMYVSQWLNSNGPIGSSPSNSPGGNKQTEAKFLAKLQGLGMDAHEARSVASGMVGGSDRSEAREVQETSTMRAAKQEGASASAGGLNRGSTGVTVLGTGGASRRGLQSMGLQAPRSALQLDPRVKTAFQLAGAEAAAAENAGAGDNNIDNSGNHNAIPTGQSPLHPLDLYEEMEFFFSPEERQRRRGVQIAQALAQEDRDHDLRGIVGPENRAESWRLRKEAAGVATSMDLRFKDLPEMGGDGVAYWQREMDSHVDSISTALERRTKELDLLKNDIQARIQQKSQREAIFEQQHDAKQSKINELTVNLNKIGQAYLSETEKFEQQNEIVKALTEQCESLKKEKEDESKKLLKDFEKIIERITTEFQKDTDYQLEEHINLFKQHRKSFIKLMDKAKEDVEAAKEGEEREKTEKKKILIITENLFNEYGILEETYGKEIDSLEKYAGDKDKECKELPCYQVGTTS